MTSRFNEQNVYSLEKGFDEEGRCIVASSEDENEIYYSSSKSSDGKNNFSTKKVIQILLLVVCLLLLGCLILLVVFCKPTTSEIDGGNKLTEEKPTGKKCSSDDRWVVFNVSNPEKPNKKWVYNADAWDRVLDKRWEDGSLRTPKDFSHDGEGKNYPLVSKVYHSFQCKIHNHLFFEKYKLPGPQVIGWAGNVDKLKKVIEDLEANDYVFKVTQLQDSVGVLIVRDGKVANDFRADALISQQFEKRERVAEASRLTEEDVGVLKSFQSKGKVVTKDMLLELGKVLLKADRSTWDTIDSYMKTVHPGIIIEKPFDPTSEVKFLVVLGKVWGYTDFASPDCQPQTKEQLAKSKALAEQVAVKLGVDFVRMDIAINAEGNPQIVEATLQAACKTSIAMQMVDGRFPSLVNWHKARNQELKKKSNYKEKTGPPTHLSDLDDYWPEGNEQPNVCELSKV